MNLVYHSFLPTAVDCSIVLGPNIKKLHCSAVRAKGMCKSPFSLDLKFKPCV